MDRTTRGTVIALLGVCLLVGTLAVSGATAPDRGVSDGRDRQTLVGSQSAEGGWHEGGTVYLLDGNEGVWREGSADSYFDVTMLPNGSVMAGFMHSGYETGCEPYGAPCTKTGFRVIDPNASGGPAVISEYSFPVRTSTNSEVHDVEKLDSGEYLLSDMEHERIVTVRDGEETWEWEASSFYNAPEDPTREDWLHINDVDAVNETHYLVSVRNANQIVLVERGEGVVEVINEDRSDADDDSCRGQLVPDADGDVRCGDPDVINHQHNPQWLDEGAVLVADSDNNRVVELHENQTTGEWEPVWTLSEANGIPLDWPRDADRLDNGNTLVTDVYNSRLLEVTPNKTVAWTGNAYHLPYEAERLPEGERAGASRYSADGTIDAPRTGVPVLSPVVFGLRGQFPFIPFWFGESQFVLTLLSLGLLVAGGVLRWRD